LIGVLFANSCFGSSYELASAGKKVMEILIEEKLAEENEFLPGLTCASIYEIKDKKKSKRVEPTDAVNNAIEAVNLLKSKISLYQVEDVNPVIRALGRRRLVTPIFELLDCMRAAGKYAYAYVHIYMYMYSAYVRLLCHALLTQNLSSILKSVYSTTKITNTTSNPTLSTTSFYEY
jgi:hypothetical protein